MEEKEEHKFEYTIGFKTQEQLNEFANIMDFLGEVFGESDGTISDILYASPALRAFREF